MPAIHCASGCLVTSSTRWWLIMRYQLPALVCRSRAQLPTVRRCFKAGCWKRWWGSLWGPAAECQRPCAVRYGHICVMVKLMVMGYHAQAPSHACICL